MAYSKFKKATLLITTAIILCGCQDNQSKAESTIEKFIDENCIAADYTINFGKLDSTKNVTNTAINAMRIGATKNKTFKKNIRYAPAETKYTYMPAKICIGNDTTRYTFYLNSDLTQIVSFK